MDAGVRNDSEVPVWEDDLEVPRPVGHGGLPQRTVRALWKQVAGTRLRDDREQMVDFALVEIPSPRNALDETSKCRREEVPKDWQTGPCKLAHKKVGGGCTKERGVVSNGYESHASLDRTRQLIRKVPHWSINSQGLAKTPERDGEHCRVPAVSTPRFGSEWIMSMAACQRHASHAHAAHRTGEGRPVSVTTRAAVRS